MKREIKFRAFGANTMGVVDSYGQDFCAVRWGKDEVACDVFTGDIEVMQFTGLKDRHGTEIYEGDKVKRRVHLVEGSDYMDYICEVRWNGWCYGLFIHDKHVWSLDPITARELEIVGNIYSNP